MDPPQPMEGKYMLKILRFGLGIRQRGHHCPSCSSTRVRRSRRNGVIERSLLRVLAVHAYRCEDCDERYFSFGHRHEPLDQPQTSPSGTPHALKS
jgi:YgiT-type zinc finger domain-containing protein